MRKILLLPLGVLLGPWTFCYAQEQKQSNTEATVETGVPETRAADGRAPILFSNYNRTDPGQEEYYAVEGLAVNTPKISGKIYGATNPICTQVLFLRRFRYIRTKILISPCLFPCIIRRMGISRTLRPMGWEWAGRLAGAAISRRRSEEFRIM